MTNSFDQVTPNVAAEDLKKVSGGGTDQTALFWNAENTAGLTNVMEVEANASGTFTAKEGVEIGSNGFDKYQTVTITQSQYEAVVTDAEQHQNIAALFNG